MKAKTEPATTRIMRLLDRLSTYSFNLYYVKGRDMILSDYLSRHRQEDLDPSELIPISFCCLKVYRSFINDRTGQHIFCIKTKSSAIVSGEQVGEVHGTNKPWDPNYKPEHQSKSKLPSVTGKSSPQSVTIQSEPMEAMPAPIPNPTPMGTPVSVHGGAHPKTHRADGTPLLPPTALPSPSKTQPLVTRRIPSSTPLGEKARMWIEEVH